MSLISKRRLASLATGSALIATMAVATMPMAALAAKPPTAGPVAKATAAYTNDFKFASDAGGATTSNQTMFDVTRVASGTDGIKSASGGWHAQAAHNDYETGTASPFTRYGGYSSTFGNGYTTSVDIYLDMTKATGGDLRFDWSSAISSTVVTPEKPTNHLRDFVFSVGTMPAVEGSFIVSASNNAPGNPSGGANPLTISKSGWYTFKHEFKNVNGTLSVDMKVIDAKGGVLGTWTLSTVTDTIGPGGIVGGNRYGWLVDSDFETLALDNITRVQN